MQIQDNEVRTLCDCEQNEIIRNTLQDFSITMDYGILSNDDVNNLELKIIEMNGMIEKENNIFNMIVPVRIVGDDECFANKNIDIGEKNNNYYINYDEIFNYKNEENSIESSTRLNTPIGKKRDIYISDQEDKDYDPYKIEFDYMQNLKKKQKFLDYLNIEKEIREKNSKMCCNIRCIVF